MERFQRECLKGKVSERVSYIGGVVVHQDFLCTTTPTVSVTSSGAVCAGYTKKIDALKISIIVA